MWFRVILWLYEKIILLYPQSFRQRLGEEMVEVFAQTVAEARRESERAALRVVLRELLAFLPSLVAAHRHELQKELKPLPAGSYTLNWVAGWPLLSMATLPLAWLLAAPLGALLLRFPGVWTGSRTPSGSTMMMLGFALGLGPTTAVGQWLLLRRYLPRAGWWIPLSVGGTMAAAVVLLSLDLFDEWALVRPWAMLAFLGAGAGVGQWFYLRLLVPGAKWWPIACLMAFGLYLFLPAAVDAGGELLFGLGSPYVITGFAMWVLLSRAAQGKSDVAAGAEPAGVRANKRRKEKRRLALSLVFMMLFSLVLVGPVVYARAQLALAKEDGIYPSPAEGLVTRAADVEGAKLVGIGELESGPAWRDGRLPHVWYAMARVTYDRPPTYWDRTSSSVGSYYLRVQGGWVHMSEGAFPNFVGRAMEVYHLEGAGGTARK